PRPARGEEALDLPGHAADGLDVAVLVDRARHRDPLVERQAGEGGEERVQLGRRGGVALDLVVGLLERQRGRERERPLLPVGRGEVARQDEDALRVDRPGELDLALDARDLPAAHRDPGAHPGREAEAVVAEVDDREPVHLADPAAARLDRDRPVGDQLADALLEQVRPVVALAHGERDVVAGDERVARLARAEARLGDEVGDLLQARGQLALALAQPPAVLDHPGDRAAVEVQEAAVAHAPADERGVAALVRGRPVELGGEVRLHLEELAEALVEGVEEVVELARAEEDDLDVDRDRLRAQARARQRAQLLAEVLDPHLAAAQGALQRVPGERVPEHVERHEHEEAAVRPLQRPGLDLAEVGHHRAERGAVLDAADEVVVGRVALHDDRSAAEGGVVDEDVDPELHALRTLAGERGEGERQVAGAPELGHVLEQVLLDLLEVGEHLRNAAELVLELAEEGAGGEQRDLAVEPLHPLGGLLLELAQPVHEAGDPLLHLRRRPRDLRLPLGGEAPELLARERLPVDERHRHDPGGRLAHGEAAVLREAVELVLERRPPLADLARELALAALVLLALEGARELALDRLDEAVHGARQAGSVPGRERDRAGAVGRGEVVDVDPVGRGRHPRRAGLEGVEHGGEAAGAGLARDEDVEAAPVDGEPEFDRVERPRLADRPDQRLDLGRAREPEPLRVDATAQLPRAKLEAAACGARPVGRGLGHAPSVSGGAGRGHIGASPLRAAGFPHRTASGSVRRALPSGGAGSRRGAAPPCARADRRAGSYARGRRAAGARRSRARIAPASASCTQAGSPRGRIGGEPRWVGKSAFPPGRGSGRTCSRSGAEAETAPSVTGSSGPWTAARASTDTIPAAVSNRREAMSSCGTTSPRACRSGPSRSAARRERVAFPARAPVATWSVTIICRLLAGHDATDPAAGAPAALRSFPYARSARAPRAGRRPAATMGLRTRWAQSSSNRRARPSRGTAGRRAGASRRTRRALGARPDRTRRPDAAPPSSRTASRACSGRLRSGSASASATRWRARSQTGAPARRCATRAG